MSPVRQALLGERFVALIAGDYPARGHTVSEVRSKSAGTPDATILITPRIAP